MALEGHLRDLSLTEVLQLLTLGRKQGALHVDAPLQGRRGTIWFRNGAVVDAVVRPLIDVQDGDEPRRRADDATQVEEAVLDVLAWRDGYFRFAPMDPAPHTTAETTVHLAVEPLLMEATVRAEVWARINARVPHARVVPSFVDADAQQLPLLRLTPAQWDLLTRVDGKQDLMALAAITSKPLTEVAEMVHDLIAAGVLVLHDGEAPVRRNPTPPVVAAVDPHDLWVPTHESGHELDDDHAFDAVFDPITVGVLTPEGLPRQRTPMVASVAVQQSVETGLLSSEAAQRDAVLDDVALGDSLAREGDLHGAVALWHRALHGPLPETVAVRVREQVALATRLSELLS